MVLRHELQPYGELADTLGHFKRGRPFRRCELGSWNRKAMDDVRYWIAKQ